MVLRYVGKWAVYKSGTGTRGRGHRDACVGTWDVGMRGRVGRGRRDVNDYCKRRR